MLTISGVKKIIKVKVKQQFTQLVSVFSSIKWNEAFLEFGKGERSMLKACSSMFGTWDDLLHIITFIIILRPTPSTCLATKVGVGSVAMGRIGFSFEFQVPAPLGDRSLSAPTHNFPFFPTGRKFR